PYGDQVDPDDAQLVVSELTTNAVIHAGTPFSVAVRSDGSAVRISVQDWSTMQPVMRDDNPVALSGRGLRLIAMVSRAWGVEYGRDGKTVGAGLAWSGPGVSSAVGDAPAAHHRVARPGQDQHDRGGDVDARRADPHQRQSVEHGGDDHAAEQCVDHLASAAE